MKKWITNVINNPKSIAIPIMTHPGIEMIGKTVQDAVTDGKIHAKAIKALNERYPSGNIHSDYGFDGRSRSVWLCHQFFERRGTCGK